jgi:magnesium chelatase subunit I
MSYEKLNSQDRLKIKTVKALKESGYQSEAVKEELRRNLIAKMRKGENVFEGIWGYEDTVIPDIQRAILSRHNINLLGLRGQAKTRIARMMTLLLDEYIPVLQGTELNDDPLQPLSRTAIDILDEKGDSAAVSWMHRSERYTEKLATPDVSVADLIGDVDPIKAATLKLPYSDERVIHYGLIPRSHRGIFVINELPDLQARIQVALFNILQEGDIQIRGFKLRLPLDLQFVFTANPEDYTNRGSIITPLKDRIGSQILTHYPDTIAIAKTITAQEAKLDKRQSELVYVPELAKDLLEQISFEARESEFIDEKSGISARLSITAYENLLSTAERRTLKSGNNETLLRFGDFLGVVPAITGKVELVYEGEEEGAASVAVQLIGDAVKTLFPLYFPKIEKLQRPDETTPYDDLVEWFFEQSGFELSDELSDTEYKERLDSVKPLDELINKYHPELNEKNVYFYKEFLLWALVEYKKLSKHRFSKGVQFNDLYGSYINDL